MDFEGIKYGKMNTEFLLEKLHVMKQSVSNKERCFKNFNQFK